MTKESTKRITTKLREYSKLAGLLQKRELLKEQITVLQDSLLEKYEEKEVETPNGILSLQIREKWNITDNKKVIKLITQAVFNKIAGISKTKIIKEVGEVGFAKLIKSKVASPGKVSKFYKVK